MSKICPKCQTEYDDSHKFCPECGSELTLKEEQPLTQEELCPQYIEACRATGARRVKLLQQAAKVGSSDAMYDLACMYFVGEGVDENTQTAVKWLKQSADAGYGLAQELMGQAYFNGFESIEQDYNLAEKYLHAAALKGSHDAQRDLAYLYMILEDYENALPWVKKTVLLGDHQAYAFLGRIYSEGLGVKKNEKEGKRCYQEMENLLGKGGLYKAVKQMWFKLGRQRQYEAYLEILNEVKENSMPENLTETSGESSEVREISSVCTAKDKSVAQVEEQPMAPAVEEQPAVPSLKILQLLFDTDGNKNLFVSCSIEAHNLEGQTLDFDVTLEIASQYGKLKNNVWYSCEDAPTRDYPFCIPIVANFDYSQISIPLMKLDETVVYDVRVDVSVNGQRFASQTEQVSVYYKMSVFSKDVMRIIE